MSEKNVGVFLDRDGVVIEHVDWLNRVDQMRLLSGVADAIRMLNDHGVKAIVVTNQPVVARGLCSEQDVRRIHEVLRRMLGEKGASLDMVHYCPHHENGDRPEYRKACFYRKPNIGMLRKSTRRFDLDLERCFMIGDRTVDIQTGVNAGCHTLLVRTGYGGSDGKYDVSPDFVCENLLESADLIVNSLI